MSLEYPLIEACIRYLDERAREQPSLTELAAHVGVSPGHLPGHVMVVFDQGGGSASRFALIGVKP